MLFSCWLLFFASVDFLVRISMEGKETEETEEGVGRKRRMEELGRKEEGESGRGGADAWGLDAVGEHWQDFLASYFLVPNPKEGKISKMQFSSTNTYWALVHIRNCPRYWEWVGRCKERDTIVSLKELKYKIV